MLNLKIGQLRCQLVEEIPKNHLQWCYKNPINNGQNLPTSTGEKPDFSSPTRFLNTILNPKSFERNNSLEKHFFGSRIFSTGFEKHRVMFFLSGKSHLIQEVSRTWFLLCSSLFCGGRHLVSKLVVVVAIVSKLRYFTLFRGLINELTGVNYSYWSTYNYYCSYLEPSRLCIFFWNGPWLSHSGGGYERSC